MKYLSIDLETTGLDPMKADVLEIAAVLDDLDVAPLRVPVTVENLPYFRAVIYRPIYRTDAYCASLHKKLWDEIKHIDKTRIEGEGRYWGRWNGQTLMEDLDISKAAESCGPLTLYTTPEYIIGDLLEWLDPHRNLIADQDDKPPKQDSITPAGKNFGAFDLQFLKALPIATEAGEKLPFKHRALDPGSLYYMPGDEMLPDLKECKKRAGLSDTDVSHTALDDARDVIRILRKKKKKKNYCKGRTDYDYRIFSKEARRQDHSSQ